MTVSGRRRAAVGYRGRRLEREVDESGGRRSRRQSRTLDMRLMRCWASAQHDIRYSIFLFLRQEHLGQQVKISRRRKHSDYFRQVRCSIFDFDLFHSEHLGRALTFRTYEQLKKTIFFTRFCMRHRSVQLQEFSVKFLISHSLRIFWICRS